MTRTLVGLCLLLSVSACERTASLGRQFTRGGGDETSTGAVTGIGTSAPGVSSGEESTAAASTLPVPSSSSSDDSTTSDAESSSSSSSDGTSSATTDTDGLPPRCTFETPWTRCEICMHAACCPPVRACQFERECACFWDCFKYNRPRDECATICRYEFDQVDEVLFCSTQWCALECAPLPS